VIAVIIKYTRSNVKNKDKEEAAKPLDKLEVDRLEILANKLIDMAIVRTDDLAALATAEQRLSRMNETKAIASLARTAAVLLHEQGRTRMSKAQIEHIGSLEGGAATPIEEFFQVRISDLDKHRKVSHYR